MPLSTQIVRDNAAVPIEGGWSFWHLMRLWDAIKSENPLAYSNTGKLRAAFDPNKVGPYPYGYVFKYDHTFTTNEDHIWTNGEVGKPYSFTVKAGDVYNCWR